MKLADIHCHLTFKPFYRDTWTNAGEPTFSVQKFWGEIHNECEGQLTNTLANAFAKEVVKHSQCNFDRLCRSGHKLVFASLFPIEKPFIDTNQYAAIGPDDALKILQCLIGINRHLADDLEDVDDYMWLLQKEYEQFKKLDGQGSFVAGTDDLYKVYFADNWQEIESNLANSKRIGVVLTIEGVQSLCPVPVHGQQVDLAQIKQNITFIKQNWAPPPLFITFCHHFWNGLAGHAESIKDELEMAGVFNQNYGRSESINAQGYEVIDALLEKKENERRILIDIKHFSAKSRKAFYQHMNANYAASGDNVPIMCSHTGVSSYLTLDDQITAEENDAYKNVDKTSFLHEWSINLCAEDVHEIYKSGGLIGLQMDFKRLCGKKVAKKAYTKNRSPEKMAEEKALSVKIVVANILTMVKYASGVIPNEEDKHRAWDIVCIGSDNDGLVNALKDFQTSAELPDLIEEIRNYLNNPDDIRNPVKQGDAAIVIRGTDTHILKFGLTTDEIIDKITFGNVRNFLEKYYHDDYLLG